MLLDADRIERNAAAYAGQSTSFAPLDTAIGELRAEAVTVATFLQETWLRDGTFYNNPLLTLNAFAFSG